MLITKYLFISMISILTFASEDIDLSKEIKGLNSDQYVIVPHLETNKSTDMYKNKKLISTKDISSHLGHYAGIHNKPANHISIEGQEFVFVKESEYQNYISKHFGVKGKPANYLKINSETVVVIPVEDHKFPALYDYPTAENIHDSDRNKFKEALERHKGESYDLKIDSHSR